MSAPADLATRLTDLVGTRLPVVQTGMGWVAGASLTSATSNAGGLGILAAATLDRSAMREAVDRIRSRTDRPFGVNMRPDQSDLGDRVRDLVAASVRIVSFAGPPTSGTVAALHDAGAIVIVTVGARRHAEKMLSIGVDALIAQGAEGGGHTGSIPTSILLPDVIDAVEGRIPVIAAGGFRDGRGLASALLMGADGVAMGTRFLLTSESRVPDAVKQRYLATGPADTVVTRALDGAPQRVIRTALVDKLEGTSAVRRLPGALQAAAAFRRVSGDSWASLLREGWAMRRRQGLRWTEVALAAYTPTLTRAALVEGDVDSGVLPTGQVVGVIDDLPSVADLLASIEEDALRYLGGAQQHTKERIR